MSQRALEKLKLPVAVLKSKPKMGPKNGVRKPAQKSVALTVASPVATSWGSPKKVAEGPAAAELPPHSHKLSRVGSQNWSVTAPKATSLQGEAIM